MSGTPSAPEKLHYTDRGKTSITLAWEPPRTDGGSPITGYYVEKMRSDSNEFEVANRKIFTKCCGTIENLSENQEYQFRVKAVNEVGDGEPSKAITAKIQDDESMNVARKQSITNINLRTITRRRQLKECSLVYSCSSYHHPEVLQEQCHHCEKGLSH